MTRGGKREGAGRPVKGDPKVARINIRTTAGRHDAYLEAAFRAGMSLTDWIEITLDAAANKPIEMHEWQASAPMCLRCREHPGEQGNPMGWCAGCEKRRRDRVMKRVER